MMTGATAATRRCCSPAITVGRNSSPGKTGVTIQATVAAAASYL